MPPTRVEVSPPEYPDMVARLSEELQVALLGKLPTSAFSGLSKITVSPTPPYNPQEGDVWIDTST